MGSVYVTTNWYRV